MPNGPTEGTPSDPEAEARRYAEAIIRTARQPLLQLDGDLRVELSNRAFLQAFNVTRAETEGRLIYDLGNGQWNIPDLRHLLEDILAANAAPDTTVEDYRVEHDFPGIGRRTMLLNARRLVRPGRADTILLAIDDITEHERLRWLLQGEREYARKLIDATRDPVLVLGWDYRIRAANLAFCTTFQTTLAATEGQPLHALGNGQWNIPALRDLLEKILPHNDRFDDFEVEHDFPAIGRRIMVLNARRVDHLQLILLAIEDQTEIRLADRALRRNEALLASLLRHAPVGIGLTDRTGRWLIQNDLLHSLSAGLIPSRDPAQAPLWHPVGNVDPADWPAARALRGEPNTLDFRAKIEGQDRWLRVNAAPVEVEGTVEHVVVLIEDITEDKRSELERELLLAELNHRVKNLFLVIRSLVSQGTGNAEVEAYKSTLKGRIDALAGAHALALEGRWGTIGLTTIAARTLKPYAAGTPSPIAMTGPLINLPARQALSVSLVLHELATNAVKYGALSTPAGHVALSWATRPGPDGPRLHLAWHESGGPPARDPTRHGFGLDLIERVFAYDLQGHATLTFLETGLHLEAWFPLG